MGHINGDETERPKKVARVTVPMTVAGQLRDDALVDEIRRVCVDKIHEINILQNILLLLISNESRVVSAPESRKLVEDELPDVAVEVATLAEEILDHGLDTNSALISAWIILQIC